MELTVKITTNPEIITYPDAVKKSGRLRVQLETRVTADKLDHAFIYPEIGRKGIKVIIVNDKWNSFLEYCKANSLENA